MEHDGHEDEQFTHEQIIGFLGQAEPGVFFKDRCRKAVFSGATFCKRQVKVGGMDVSDAKRLNESHGENAEREKLLAEVHLDIAVLERVFGCRLRLNCDQPWSAPRAAKGSTAAARTATGS